MKTLGPFKILTLGPILLGLAFSVGTWLVMPNSRDWPGFGWALAIGAAGGFAVFGPIAGIIAIQKRWPSWLGQHAWVIGFYSSLAMMLSMGYLAACVRHRVWDGFMLVAFALLFFGAEVKATLSYALRHEGRNGTC
jgi:hypothetical protein